MNIIHHDSITETSISNTSIDTCTAGTAGTSDTTKKELSTNTISNRTYTYLLIENPNKSNNLGPILRCASAFAIHQIILIGSEKCTTRGSHGSSKHLNIKAFANWQNAVSYLKNECGVVSIVGVLGDVSVMNNSNSNCNGSNVVSSGGLVKVVQGNSVVKVVPVGLLPDSKDGINNDNDNNIVDETLHPKYPLISHPIHTRPFSNLPKNATSTKGQGNICFSIHKRSFGLPIEQAEHCDSFVHIETSLPTFTTRSPTTTATTEKIPTKYYNGLLDSQTCLSIVLHHYNEYIGLNERDFEGHKFVVDKTQKGKFEFNDNGDEVRRRREEKRREIQREIEEQEIGDDDEKDFFL
jgi:hypothetical protein